MSDRIERVSFPTLVSLDLDEIIDVRSPGEYAIDHLTGAINLPVLQDDERAEVGTLYKQISPFDARKMGAGLVSANISRHMREHFAGKPKTYRPAIYCWRGGQRSRSLATVLAEVGWRPALLDGGYKAYRTHVIEVIATASRYRWCVINGYTGSGKTLVLQALRDKGAQVLDLEGLANHKGSLFGGDAFQPQPSQKRFESLIRDHLVDFDPGEVVFVEAESPKIGHLNIPAPLWQVMRDSLVMEIDASVDARTDYLHGDYDSWIADPGRILETLERLRPFHARAQISEWLDQCHKAAWKSLIRSLLVEHYDKRYGVAGSGHYDAPSARYPLPDHRPVSVESCADWLLKQATR